MGVQDDFDDTHRDGLESDEVWAGRVCTDCACFDYDVVEATNTYDRACWNLINQFQAAAHEQEQMLNDYLFDILLTIQLMLGSHYEYLLANS